MRLPSRPIPSRDRQAADDRPPTRGTCIASNDQREHLLVDLERGDDVERRRAHVASAGEQREDDRRDRERAVRRDERQRVRRRRAAPRHEVRHRRGLRRAPQQREDLEPEARSARGRARLSTNGSSTSRPARPMSQSTITLRRSKRSMITPPTVPRKKPGTHAGDHDEAHRGARVVGDARRDREDRDEPDPVAEARDDLREPEPEERLACRRRRQGAAGPAARRRLRGMNGRLALAGCSLGASRGYAPGSGGLRAPGGVGHRRRGAFFGAAFFARRLLGRAVFLAVVFLAGRLLRRRLGGAFFFWPGRAASRSRSSSTPCSSVDDSGSTPRGHRSR